MDDIMRKFLKAMKNGQGVAIPMPEGFNLDDLLPELSEKQQIGKVPAELLKRYRKMNRKREELDEEIDILTKQISLEGQRRIDETFGEQLETLSEEKDAIWDEIADLLNVPRSNDGRLSIDIRDGTVSAKKSTILPNFEGPVQ